MLLVIDVGNTNIVLGVYDKTELVGHWRISTDRVRTTDEYGMLMMNLFFHDRKVDVKDINAIIISSVVPPLMPTLERVCLRYFNVNPLIVGPGTKTGIAIKYDNPREVGADRIVNAVAAHELYKGDLIIIDFGTATTYCAVQGNGDLYGRGYYSRGNNFCRGFIPTGGQITSYRCERPWASHLPEYGVFYAIWYVLRLCRSSRRPRVSYESGNGKSCNCSGYRWFGTAY